MIRSYHWFGCLLPRSYPPVLGWPLPYGLYPKLPIGVGTKKNSPILFGRSYIENTTENYSFIISKNEFHIIFTFPMVVIGLDHFQYEFLCVLPRLKGGDLGDGR